MSVLKAECRHTVWQERDDIAAIAAHRRNLNGTSGCGVIGLMPVRHMIRQVAEPVLATIRKPSCSRSIQRLIELGPAKKLSSFVFTFVLQQRGDLCRVVNRRVQTKPQERDAPASILLVGVTHRSVKDANEALAQIPREHWVPAL